MRTHLAIVPFVIAATAMGFAIDDRASDDRSFTADFDLARTRFTSTSENTYYPLRPGAFLRLVGVEDGQLKEVEITVLEETKRFRFMDDGKLVDLEARIVEEREWLDGELSELTRNYVASSSDTGDVFYLGEDVDIYEEGQAVSHAGAWQAGRDDARPGLMMPGLFLVGSRYQQENAPGVSMDRAEHIESGLSVVTPAGVFKDCVMTMETTPLEPDEETAKIYAPGIGIIADGPVQLVEYRQ